MSDYKSKYRELYNVTNSLRDSQINSMKRKIIESFTDSPSYYQVYINDSTTPSDVWIIDDSDSKELKQIQTKPNVGILNIGDLVKWKSSYWLVQIVDDMVAYHRGSMQLCNTSLSLPGNKVCTVNGQNDFGEDIIVCTPGTPLNLPCIVERTIVTTTRTEQAINLPEGRASVTIPFTIHDDIAINKTVKLFGEDYKIRDIDYSKSLGNTGLLVLITRKDMG